MELALVLLLGTLIIGIVLVLIAGYYLLKELENVERELRMMRDIEMTARMADIFNKRGFDCSYPTDPFNEKSSDSKGENKKQ